ncbi:hypothetical protein AAHA92_18609 [Salvia divinorum]|uniref:Transmembrane protein n=1 Tax=Salvia divinorum TaxID=28513 RepID=A0ABD1H2M5_SALDI
MKSSVLCLVLVIMLFNAGTIECSATATGGTTNTFLSPHKAGVHAHSRKLLEFDVVLDYDKAGPNPKHEPRGKKGGGGARNP